MRFFSKEELKTLWPFYVDGLLMILFFIMPFMFLYFSALGFSATQIGILFAIWPLASILFEIPTGAIADIYGRKFSVVLGLLLNGIFMIMLSFFTNYFWIILLMALMGISMTLTSGSFEAWVVDLLKKKKMENFLNGFFSKRQSIMNVGIILSGFLGAFLVSIFGLGIIWIAGGASFLISAFFYIFAEEDHEKKDIKFKDSFKEIWKQSKTTINYGYKHSALFYLFIIAFIFSISTTLRGFIAWTPFLTSFGFKEAWFGLLWSAIGVVGFFAPLISNKLLKKGKEKNLLIIASIIGIVQGIFVILFNNLYLLIPTLLMGTFLLNFRTPIRMTYFQRFIPNELRATMGSVRGLLIGIASVIGLSLSGLLVDLIGGRYTLVVSASLMIPMIILYLRIREDKEIK
jgi:MFS family permease